MRKLVPQRLVLLRHGESDWNRENRFTGWTDVDLSAKGIAEAKDAGKLLKAEGYAFDLAYTSVLKRAIRTLWIALDELGQMWLPVQKDWRLNERHYGDLQGLNKAEMAAKFGDQQVLVWRRSYDTPPPELKPAEQKFNTAMREILLAASFREKDFSWKSFPNHTGHADTPGCFRCHDGKHFNDKGEVIRLQCTLCHSLPEVTRENAKGSVASLLPEKAGEKQPESHQRANFMRTHADDVGPECEQCHGAPLKRGKQGGAFCSNPACHGREWPLDLSAEPPKKAASQGLATKG